MHIKKKVLFSYQNLILIASIIPIIVFGVLTYNSSKKDSIQESFKHIQNINERKKQAVHEYFSQTMFNTYELTKAVSFLEKQAKNNITNIQTLQRNNILNHYHSITNDIVSLSKKDIFQYIYSFLRRGKTVDPTYFNEIKTYKDNLGYKNILMINEEGEVLYSSDEKSLEHSNIKNFSASFDAVFSQLQNDPNSKEVLFVDFSLDPSSQVYKQYVITPFNSVKGFIAMEIDHSKLQESINNVASLGKSAETYLVYKNEKGTFLASNRAKKTGNIGDAKDGTFIQKGFESQGVDVKYGSLGDIELVGYMPIKYKNINLSMQTTVKYTDIISPRIKGTDYFEEFVLDHNYHNLMMIGSRGDIFYSVTKEADYQTNIFSKAYMNEHLFKAVNEVFKNKEVIITDIDSYQSCTIGFAQFILSPILKEDGSIQSVLVIQLDIDHLSSILLDKTSHYNTYKTYIIGEDNKPRSSILQDDKKVSLISYFKNNKTIESQVIQNATHNENGLDILEDYRGVDVLSSFTTLKYPYFKWSIITEIDEAEVEEQLSGLKNNILIFIFISSLVALSVMIIITTEKNKQDQQLHYNAMHDALTGLPNRKFALEFLSYTLEHQKRSKLKGAVLFIDLDRFKIINDSYGHEAGDAVLIEISKRLKSILRKEDVIARLGGDEFIIIVSDFSSIVHIDKLCQKIISSVSQKLYDNEREYEVGASIGVAIFPDDSNNAEELLQYSDTAMFRAKDNGRNDFTYYSREMTEETLHISRVEEELKHAIDNNELELYYQPQIDINNSKIIGVEALVRWNHPRDGLIMPDKFIPIAEDSQLILKLGYWVAKEACKNFQKWQTEGIDLEYIAINMSAKQLQCRQCVEDIFEILDELNFPPQNLELEITESTLITNLENTLSNINAFKEIGIEFAIDDFGTGYSSLSYLKSLPVSTLKIDREFIKDIIEDPDDRSIVAAIIAMGHTLNYTIVAEGTENKEDITLLQELGCDIAQGYYYARALPEDELLQYIKNKGWEK